MSKLLSTFLGFGVITPLISGLAASSVVDKSPT
jgi:hypothetical protein